MNTENIEFDIQKIDQLALEHWQNDLGKFFVKQKEPSYTEYNMFTAGYKAGHIAACKQEEELDATMMAFNIIKKENEALRAMILAIKSSLTEITIQAEGTMLAIDTMENTDELIKDI